MDRHGLLRGLLYALYVDDVRPSQETHLWASTASYEIAVIFYIKSCSYLIGNTPMGSHGMLRGLLYFFMCG
jgi:hypothetical protein